MPNTGTTAPPENDLKTSTQPPTAPPAESAILTETLIVNAPDDTSIRPFEFHATEEALADLKLRIGSTKWPDRELVNDASQGVQLATIQKLASYWATDYDWRPVEARLNALPQFVTSIDGVDIHFIHFKSRHPNALPLIVTHGWPGSVIEQLKIIDPLTDPTAHGGTEADAFDVVIPSMPGYGFSGKPRELGWDPIRIAKAWAELMSRLGYDRYVAQGGDWGDPITEQQAILFPDRVRAIHLNMPSTVPPEIFQAIQSGKPPQGLSDDEQYAFEALNYFLTKDLAYAQEMGTRPQTLYAIEDSPVGLAAWIIDHDIRSYELIARVFDGAEEGLSKDDILDNITLYWLTNTAVSSSRLYWENKTVFFAPQGVKVPVAVSAFPDELYQAPLSWTEKAFPNLLLYKRHPKGGHFAAWEQPQAIVEDLREGFRSLR